MQERKNTQMKNKNILYIVVILFLGTCIYLLSKQDKSISRTDRRDFSIADTSEVIKVTLSSKAPEIAVLNRQNENSWTVNGKYKARKSGVFYLLQTLQRMEIAHPVPLSMRDNVIGNLAVKGIKVEVELKNGKNKTFYVGGENKELTATFMMLKDALEPYAVHIPGFKGYLSGRFFTQEYLWRDKTVINYDNRNISSIQMQYYNVNQKKDESFRITKTNMSYQLSDFETKEMIQHNPKALETYIASFRKLYAESFVTGTLNTDSLIKTQPLFELTVTTIDNQSTAIKVFNKKAEKTIYVDGDITMQDPERMFAFVNNEDWMVIQTNTFKKVIKELTELKK
tara:strand:+ start:3089 stop:4108 length:1020 start_codon:yes stop_codon:yes gene_type:complete